MLVSELVSKLLKLDQGKPILLDISPPINPSDYPIADIQYISDNDTHYIII